MVHAEYPPRDQLTGTLRDRYPRRSRLARHDETPDMTTLLSRLAPQPADMLLALIAACRADTRPDKIDVGVGVYRDIDSATPVFRAV
jgi:hypothetical protein